MKKTLLTIALSSLALIGLGGCKKPADDSVKVDGQGEGQQVVEQADIVLDFDSGSNGVSETISASAVVKFGSTDFTLKACKYVTKKVNGQDGATYDCSGALQLATKADSAHASYLYNNDAFTKAIKTVKITGPVAGGSDAAAFHVTFYETASDAQKAFQAPVEGDKKISDCKGTAVTYTPDIENAKFINISGGGIGADLAKRNAAIMKLEILF